MLSFLEPAAWSALLVSMQNDVYLALKSLD